MAEPKRKGRRRDLVVAAQSVLHVGRISNTGLSQLLTQVRAANLDSTRVLTKHVIAEAFVDRAAAMSTTINMPLADSDDTFGWTLLQPGRLMSELIAESPALQQHFWAAMQEHPPSARTPWRLVVGYDEFVPGNKLKDLCHFVVMTGGHPPRANKRIPAGVRWPTQFLTTLRRDKVDNARKVYVLSFTFAELGNLHNDALWFTPVVVRSHVVNQCEGGWGAFLKQYLRLHLFGTSGVSTAGTPLLLHGAPCVIFGRLGNILTDGDGFRCGLDWRGASSMKPCVKHPNVLRKAGTAKLAILDG